MTAPLRAVASGPPPYVGSYELAWPRLDARASRFFIHFDTFMIDHGYDFTPVRRNQKTYRRLFGMIFLEGSESMVVVYLQWLATLKILKNSKNTKAKYHFYFAKHRFSCQNPLKKARFFCQY